MSKVVAVTGASGYVAGEVVKQLLEKGYTVHATVRSVADKPKYDHLLKLPGGKLLLFEADLLSENSFDKAFEGVTAVLHTASPFKPRATDPQRDLVEPAVNGTKNVLACIAKNPSIKTVVVTSSIAAVIPQVHDKNPAKVWSDADWNENSTLTAGPYRLSKALAEKAAWDWSKEHPGIRLVTICPGFILGPIPSKRSDSESVLRCISWLDGTARANGAIPDCIPVVDVRDVAQAHIAAMEKESAHGRYLLCTLEAVTHLQMAQQLKPEFARYPLPETARPGDSYVAKFNRDKAERELGIKFISVKTSVVDMALSIVKLGLAPDWLY